ncbi:MAG: ATP-grasp domain-containing protein [Thermoplasmata archaeon]
MKRTVLITGAGGPAAVCLIKSLKRRYRVVATDINSLAPGLYLADHGFVIPRPNAPGFVAELLRVARREKASIILPTLDEELIVLARNREKFERSGITLLLASEDPIRVATNKRLTYEFFRDQPFCPRIFDTTTVEFPAVVKPVNSRGGRGFYVCENSQELQVALGRNRRAFGESVIMEYLIGSEYSVYGISGRDGKPIVTVPVRRILAVSESKRAQVEVVRSVQRVAGEIASRLKLTGPWNIQLMKSKKRITLIEVNARFAGTVSLVIAAGVNLPDLAMKVFLDRKISKEELKFCNHLVMTRYNEEIYLQPKQLIPKDR